MASREYQGISLQSRSGAIWQSSVRESLFDWMVDENGNWSW